MAALLGYKAEAIPLGLEDPLFIVEGFVDECREHRSISRIHAFSFGPADLATQLTEGWILGSSPTVRTNNLSPHSPDNALSFGAPCAIQI